MSIKELSNLFEHEYQFLSARAKHVMEAINLDDFEGFYELFVTRNETLDFAKVRNCGRLTKRELDSFVNELLLQYGHQVNHNQTFSIDLTPSSNREILTQIESLSVRSRGILDSLNCLNAKSLVDFGVANKWTFSFDRVRNCGKKSAAELNALLKKVNRILSRTDQEEEGLFSYFDKHIISTAFSEIECDILKYHMKAFDSENVIVNDDLRYVADIHNLTRERIRQISVKLKKKIDAQLKDWTEEDLKSSYPELSELSLMNSEKAYVVFDATLSSKLNSIEGTHFSTAFMFSCMKSISSETLLCKETPQLNYSELADSDTLRVMFDGILENHPEIIPSQSDTEIVKWRTDLISGRMSQKKLKVLRQHSQAFEKLFSEFSGIIVSREHGVDFAKWFDDIDDLLTSERDSEVLIDPVKSLVSYSDKTDLFNSSVVSQIIEQYIELTLKRKVDKKHGNLIIAPNAVKFKYQKIAELLDIRKQPMHYEDIYALCIEHDLKVKSVESLHSTLIGRNDVFGLKGQGFFGLRRWGGYFGTIGDVAEQLLNEKGLPMSRKDLVRIISRELIVSQDSIITVLIHYEAEDRFVPRGQNIALAKWYE